MAQKKKRIQKNFKGLRGAHIVWQSIPRKGRGVFTLKNIRKGEIIEIAPALPMAAKNVPEDEPPDGWVLEWNLKKKSEKYALGLGYIMVYNHSSKPNIDIEHDLRSKTFEVVALRNIKAGEELCWDYNCGDVWFKEI